MMEVGTFLQIIAIALGVIVGAGGIMATIWAVGKVKGVETSIDLLNRANDGLRSANEDLRVELLSKEHDCGERISRLEGQNAALLDGLGDKLAMAIADRLEPVLSGLATRLVATLGVEGTSTRDEIRSERFRTRGDTSARDSRDDISDD